MEGVLGFLEFEVFILIAIHPRLETFEGRFHGFGLQSSAWERGSSVLERVFSTVTENSKLP